MFAVFQNPIESAVSWLRSISGTIRRASAKARGKVSCAIRKLKAVAAKDSAATERDPRKVATLKQLSKQAIKRATEVLRKAKALYRKGELSVSEFEEVYSDCKKTLDENSPVRSSYSVKGRTPLDQKERKAKYVKPEDKPNYLRDKRHKSKKVYISPAQRLVNKIADEFRKLKDGGAVSA